MAHHAFGREEDADLSEDLSIWNLKIPLPKKKEGGPTRDRLRVLPEKAAI